MDSSDRTRRKMQQAITCNFQANYSAQPNSIAQDCIFSGPYPVRYPSYEFRNAILSECCPKIISATEMFSMVMRVNEPVSFSLMTKTQTNNVVVDWGDGQSDMYSNNMLNPNNFSLVISHTYSALDKDYTIRVSCPISASITALYADGSTTTNKITSIVFTANAKLTLIRLFLPNNLLSTIDLTNCSSFISAILDNNILTNIIINEATISTSIGLRLNNNRLSTSIIQTLLTQLLAYNKPRFSDGDIDYTFESEGQTPIAPIDPFYPAKTGLEALGCRVLTDLPAGSALNFSARIRIIDILEPFEFEIFLDIPNVTFQIDWADNPVSGPESYTSALTTSTPEKGYPTTIPISHLYGTTGARWPSIIVPTTAKISAIICNRTNKVNRVIRTQNEIYFSNIQTSLLYLDLTGNFVLDIGVSNFTALTTLIIPDASTQTLIINNCTALNYINAQNNNISNINEILQSLVDNGVDGGTALLDLQTPLAIPTTGDPDGVAALAILESVERGPWTISVDS